MVGSIDPPKAIESRAGVLSSDERKRAAAEALPGVSFLSEVNVSDGSL